MSEETFTCDRCGQEFPKSQMKEVFIGEDTTKKKLCPNCLDQVMNAADDVRGVEGDEKQAAVAVDTEPPGDRETYGERQ